MTSMTTGTAAVRARTRGGAGQLRLTRRGRLVVLLAVLLAILATAVAVGSSVVATSGAGEPVVTRTVTVQPGQTLWGIAAASSAPGDLRDAIYDIEQLNGLNGPELQIGQRLFVPEPD